MNFLRRLLGRGQDAATSTMDQASSAARDPRAHLAEGAQAASTVAASAPAPADSAATDLSSELNPETLSKFGDAINQLGPEQLQSATQQAIEKMPESTRGDLFTKAQSYLQDRGTSTAQSTAIAEGDTGALSQVLAGLMKEGPGALSDLFTSGGTAAAASGGGGAGIGGLVNQAVGALGGEGGGFTALLSNPLARQVLAFLVPAILGAVRQR